MSGREATPAPVGSVQRDRATERFFEGTADGRFLLKRCSACGSYSAPTMTHCESCDSPELSDVPATGAATLVSWTVPHRRGSAGGDGELPVLVIGQLEEGPWWWTRLMGADPRALRVGLPLRLAFEAAEEGEAVPVFELVSGE